MTARLVAGSVLGYRYTLSAPIASGGMGDVWSATDDILLREVAVKVVRLADDPGARDRFRDEARTSAALQHANIAAVYDYGEEDGLPFIVMELVPGQPLSELIRDAGLGGMEPDRVRSIIGQAALALSAAHEAGVVHRDVKPANIIVTPEGQAKLTDFGISRAGEGRGHTLTGEMLGTPEYISPEQAQGEPATAASDLYSLAIVAHEMLSGAKPFDSGSPVATAVAQVSDAPPPLPAWVPDDLAGFVEACLDKSPDRRPSDARAVAEMLLDPPARMPLSSLAPPLTSLPSPTEELSGGDELFPTQAWSATPEPDWPAAPTDVEWPAAPPETEWPSVPSDVEWPRDPQPATQVMAVVGAQGASQPSEGSRAQRHTTRKAVRWGWLAVPVVALVVWAAFAFGSMTGAKAPAASPTGVPGTHSTTPVTTRPTPTGTMSTTSATSSRTTSTSSTPTGTTSTTSVPPQYSHPGKGRGKGKKP